MRNKRAITSLTKYLLFQKYRTLTIIVVSLRLYRAQVFMFDVKNENFTSYAYKRLTILK